MKIVLTAQYIPESFRKMNLTEVDQRMRQPFLVTDLPINFLRPLMVQQGTVRQIHPVITHADVCKGIRYTVPVLILPVKRQ